MKPMTTFSCIAAIMLASLPVRAEPVKAVVELFTSQSCSSCPPADNLFGQLVEKDGVIGIAWHVDYWNYLDWKDTFSSAKATERQYAYAKSFGTTQVYTPQFVLNGREPIKSETLLAAMADTGSSSLPVEVMAAKDGGRLIIKTGPGEGEANLVLVQYDNEETVKVARGENAGRTIDYHYAVTDIQTVGMWGGKAMQIELPAKEYMPEKGKGCAILLQRVAQDGSPLEILGATKISWN